MRPAGSPIGLLGVLVSAGCFGSGPIPSQPSDATVVFSIPDTGDCAAVGYIGDFAIQDGNVAVVVAPNTNVCNGNGVTPPTSVFTLPVGGPATPFTTFAASEGARVALVAGTPLMAYLEVNSGTVAVQLGTGSGIPVSLGSFNGGPLPAGIVDDGAELWLAVTTNPNNMGPNTPPFDDPEFPNHMSEFNGGGNSGTDALVRIGFDGTITPQTTPFAWFCGSMPDCFVQNSTTLFGFVAGDPGGTTTNTLASIVETANGSGEGTFSTIERIAQQSIPAAGNPNVQAGPTGLAADDGHVAWTIAADLSNGGTGCQVWAQELGSATSGSGTMLMQTTAFSCTGAAVDGSDVYVAIVHPASNNNNGGGDFSGAGIARIGFDGTYASIATEFAATPYSGPRRVYAGSDGQSIIAVDPHAIGIIQKSAFDGRDDIHH